MSVLTRIKNNQILDSTIYANAKIVPGSIVGSLFNSNITMTSDVTITGNLTVQGASTYLTVASTNTFVNDPLIVMNNAFSGTNTYDLGIIFNRGSLLNQAIIWNEFSKEFRLVGTTETGTTYGNINQTNFANLRIGSLVADNDISAINVTASDTVQATTGTITGNLAVNGGGLTTSQSTFDLLNTTATTVNFAGAATSLVVGEGTGTINLRGANLYLPNATTIHSAQSTLSIANQVTSTLNIGGEATTVTLGATTGALSLRNANIWLPNATTLSGAQTSIDLFAQNVTTANLLTAATALVIGSTTGTVTLRNALVDIDANASVGGTLGVTGDTTLTGDLAVNGGDLTTSQTTFNLINATATTLNIGGDATTLNLGAVSGTTTVKNNLDVDLSLNARDINSTVIGNVTPAAATFTELTTQGATQLNLTTATAINNTPIGNATPSTGAFTTLNTTGNTSLSFTTATAINNTPIGNATASSGAFTTLTASGITQVTNTTEATAVGTGAFRVSGGASVVGNLYVGGNINFTGNAYSITGNSGVFYGDVNGFGALYAGVTGYTPLPQTVLQTSADYVGYAQNNFQNINTNAKSSTDWVATSGDGTDFDHYINMGITTAAWDGTQDNSLTNAVGANDGYLYVQGNASHSSGNLTIGASTFGTKKVSIIVGGNTSSYITAVFRNPGTAATDTTSGALTVVGGVGIYGNVYANNLSTGGSISTTDLTLSGDLAVNGGDITTSASTFNLLDANATTVNFAGAATTLTIGSTSGNTTVQNRLLATDTSQSTNTTTGAIVTSGGVGIAKNLNVGGDVVITGNLQVDGAVTTVNTATLDVEDLNITVAKGAANPAAANGAGLTVDGANATFTYADSDDSWNVNKLLKGTALQLTGNVASQGTLTARDIQSTVIGNVTPAAATFTELTSQGATQLNLTTAVAINNTPIGNATPSTGAFTTLNTTGNTSLSFTTATAINNTPIGNSTPNTGAFTTLTASGATTLTDNTTSIDTTTGALVVTGGVGVGGNLNAGALGVSGDTTLAGDLAVNGGDLTTNQTTFNLVNSTATTLNLGGAATTLTVGGTSGTLNLRNANVWLPNATTLDGAQTSIDLFTLNATSANLLTSATAITIGAVSGTLTLRNALVDIDANASVGGTLGVTGDTTLTGDLAVNGGDLTTSQTTFNLVNANATTLNVGGDATTVNIGATSGTTNIKNNLDVDLTLNARDINGTVIGNVTPAAATFTSLSSNSTTNLGSVTATSINNTPIGNATPSSGDFTRLSATGTVYANATTSSTSHTNGALVVAGGIGSAGTINIAGGNKLVVGADLTGAIINANSAISVTGNISEDVNISARNLSNVGFTEFRAESDQGFTALFGITSSAYSEASSRLSGTTAYVQAPTSDLVIGSGQDVDITVGGLNEANVIASYSATNSNVTIYSSGAAITPRIGAFTVAGGVGVGANLVVNGGAIINYGQTAGNVVIKTPTSAAGVIYDAGNQHLFINGPGYEGNTRPIKGATFAVRSQDAILIPAGSTSKRPGIDGNVDITGMLRFNTTINNLEWYNGTDWAVPGASTTVITSQQLTGNGVATVFTVNNASTTNSSIVSINGVVQAPVLAYGITGTTLTFTEPPADGDLIDVRTLTTTSVIAGLTSANGFMGIDLTDPVNRYANVTAGDSSATSRISITTDGIISLVNNAKIANQNPTINIPSASTPYVLDTFEQTKFSTAKYVVQAKRGATNIESMDAIVITDGTGNAFVSVYGVINNGTAMGTLSANVLAGNVQLYYTSTSLTNSNVRVTTSYIK